MSLTRDGRTKDLGPYGHPGSSPGRGVFLKKSPKTLNKPLSKLKYGKRYRENKQRRIPRDCD